MTLSLSIQKPGRLALAGFLTGAVVLAAQVNAGAPDGQPETETEQGIPVTSRLVIEKCGTCHAPDDKGNLSRISWIRTTPEGWAQAIKRMATLNGLYITPEESREVVKYLSASHGLAPEEAKPVMYIPEKRIINEPNIPNEDMRQACASCHAFGQPLSWRRSKMEWKLLQNMHVAMFSTAEAAYRRPVGGSEDGAGAAQGGEKKLRGDLALEYMSKTAPLHSSEWAAWQPRIRTPMLAGKWMVSAHIPGKGAYVGEMQVSPGAAKDEFRTSVSLRSLTDGTTINRTGSSIVYGGYAWRGTSSGGAGKDAQPGDPGSAAREAIWISPDQTSGEGRWFWGEYNEFGYDVKLTRASGAPVVAAVAPGAVKAGAKGVTFRIVGSDFPASLTAADIDLGAGVKVTKLLSATAGEVMVTADVASTAPAGARDVAVRGAVLAQAFPVYRKVDYMKVLPETGLARLGGARHPKGYQQFEAVGFDNGADGKPGTADDVKIGAIDATWQMKEFMAVWYDDDKDYVGAVSQSGLFTPNADGPNPDRPLGRNNYGNVWIEALARAEKDRLGKPLNAQSYLVVTVPSYQRWDQPEVSQ